MFHGIYRIHSSNAGAVQTKQKNQNNNENL